MHYSQEQIAEIEFLIYFNLESTHQGIKVHSHADKTQVEAVQRLYEKGLVSQNDGGYLTDLGRQAAEHAQALTLLLTPVQQSVAS